MDSTKSEIAEFYKDKSILITGATGFIGKVLIVKLLKSCPEVKNIFVLIREKKNAETSKRLLDMLDCPIFEDLKERNPKQLEKIVPISGDVKKVKLGLKINDLKLITENINVVFHVAATVRFDEPIKEAVETNVVGTNNMLELCQEMTAIKALIHVSTAYSYLFDRVVKERLYPPVDNPEKVITHINNLGTDVIEKMTPILIGKYPNTYSYSKSLAENLVNKKKNKIPTSIFRPTIVVCAWKEPLEGWIDNTGGPTGMLAAMAKGVVQSLFTDTKAAFDIIPVDIVVNNLIAVGWTTGVTRPEEVQVYNCSSTGGNPITWEGLAYHYQKNMKENPVNEMLWYPRCVFENNKGIHNLRVLVFQSIPAFLIDILARFTGAKPIAKKIQDKVSDRLKSLEYFVTREWIFDNTNSMELYRKLNPIDRETFYFDLQEMDWTKFLEVYWLGVRKFILKEEINTVPKARSELKRWYWIDRLYIVFIIFLVIAGLYFYFSMLIRLFENDSNISNSVEYKPSIQKLVP